MPRVHFQVCPLVIMLRLHRSFTTQHLLIIEPFKPYARASRAAVDNSPWQHRLGMVEDIGCGAQQAVGPASSTLYLADVESRSGMQEVDRMAVELQGCVQAHTGRAAQLSSRASSRQRSR
jgi:hypothetical protein